MTRHEDRIKGVLLGCAAGDALGAGYEFGRPSGGHAYMKGGGFGWEPGEWTDDTQQAILVAMERSVPQCVGEQLLAWYAEGPKDVGTTTSAALAGAHGVAAELPAAARRAALTSSAAVSNGSLMRTGPVCLPYLGEPGKIAQAARQISDLTHGSHYAGDACVLWSLAIDRAIARGSDFTAEEVMEGLSYLPTHERYWRGLIGAALTQEPSSFRPNGRAVMAFGAALSAIAHTSDLEGALQAAVSVGGDTDTVAAIAGSLAGAMYGASTIPDEWYRVLHGWPSGLRAADLEKLALEAAS